MIICSLRPTHTTGGILFGFVGSDFLSQPVPVVGIDDH